MTRNGSYAIASLPAKLLNMHCARTQGYELYISIFDKHKLPFLRYMESFVQIPASKRVEGKLPYSEAK